MEKLLSIEDIVTIVGVKKSTIYQWTHKGIIPVVRISSRCLKFSEGAISRWLAEKSFVPGAQSPIPPKPPRKKNAGGNISHEKIDSLVSRAKKEAEK
jgi:excisionase family DNA binding protein